MAEGLVTADGKTVPIDPAEQQFAAAMAAPEPPPNGARPDYPPPPKTPWLNPDGSPRWGFKADGTVRRAPPQEGRPSKNPDRAREQKATIQAAKPAQPQQPDAATKRVQRADDAQTSLELIGAGLSLVAMIGSNRARVAYEIATKAGKQKEAAAAAERNERAIVLQLDAAACSLHAETVGPSLAVLAEQNSWAAMIVDRLALFNGVASVGMALLPLVYQVIANHAPSEARDNMPPELMQLGVLPPGLLMEKLAAQNAVKMARAQSAILAEKIEAEAELARLQEQIAA